MQNFNKRHLIFITILFSGALVFGALSSCSDDPVPATSDGPSKKDGGGNKDASKKDQYIYPKLDKLVYPDTRRPADLRPWIHAEGYTGGQFGCLSDNDCFGQLCCKTPWGVNLCAPACQY